MAMKAILFVLILSLATCGYAMEPAKTPAPLLAQAQQPVPQVDVRTAPPRVMPLYEQGWNEGVKAGKGNAGAIGWFFAGFGNVPFLWLPWVVEPRRPAKPPIEAAEEFNSGYKNGYRAGWKNTHKTAYIAGAIVESVAVGAVILAGQ
jgi:hypothetical protein